jgi:hypothetical protein
MVDTYTNLLTFTPQASGDVECPPSDVYVLELVTIGAFHEKPSFENPEIIQVQSKWDFKIVDFEYDEDVDDRDWNGVTVSDYLVFFRKHPDGTTKESWKSERSNAYKMITAFLGKPPEDGDDVDLQSFVGKRIKATVAPKASGWPKISGPMAHKSKRRRAVEPDADEAEDTPNPYRRSA